ncbi:hypothetical protein FA95DRAFT_1613921 [Auriscalpium vulgare]|uniref:Uncharacterized protein n=1 Tax=Auriscalpium vulgare TaxID=40419 RepID=A0ACB8R0X5_9AGAM|nr:hypothetical protein FA95DRAFT_1613921 [Auriscalpium vulgare]
MFNTRFKKALECARRERLGPSRNMTADEVCESAAERLQALSLQQPQFSAHDQLWAIEDLLDEVVAASKLLALNLLTVDILLRDLQDPDSGITAESLSVRESVITVILVENMKAQSTYDLLGCTPPSWITELLAMEQVPAQVGRRHFTSALQKNHDALEVMRGALALFEQALTILRETVVDSL